MFMPNLGSFFPDPDPLPKIIPDPPGSETLVMSECETDWNTNKFIEGLCF